MCEDSVGGTYLGHLLGVVGTVIIPDIVAGHRHGGGPSLAPRQAHGTSVCGGDPAWRARVTFLWAASVLTLLFSLTSCFSFPASNTPSSRHVTSLRFLHFHLTRTSRQMAYCSAAPPSQISHLRVMSVFPLGVSSGAFFLYTSSILILCRRF